MIPNGLGVQMISQIGSAKKRRKPVPELRLDWRTWGWMLLLSGLVPPKLSTYAICNGEYEGFILLLTYCWWFRDPKQSSGMYKNPVKTGINYLSLNWWPPDFWLPSTVWHHCFPESARFFMHPPLLSAMLLKKETQKISPDKITRSDVDTTPGVGRPVGTRST